MTARRRPGARHRGPTSPVEVVVLVSVAVVLTVALLTPLLL
ncbi:hypothetical protein [Streptomyces sp. NPDC057412]